MVRNVLERTLAILEFVILLTSSRRQPSFRINATVKRISATHKRLKQIEIQQILEQHKFSALLYLSELTKQQIEINKYMESFSFLLNVKYMLR